MNIRQIANLSPNYFEISREERQHAAILFAALCQPGNASAFLRRLGVSHEVGPDFGIYFEYAYLRDLWNKVTDPEVRKAIVKQNLLITELDSIFNLSLEKINDAFGVRNKASKKYLQSPANWAISKFADRFPNNDDFLEICRFKWAFNIKPDIVIHLDRNTAICIEAKCESGEGSYPSTSAEKKIFDVRGLKRVGQMELQKYLMEDLLGIQTQFICVSSRKTATTTHTDISWSDAFDCLDLDRAPAFLTHMVKSISAVKPRQQQCGNPRLGHG